MVPKGLSELDIPLYMVAFPVAFLAKPVYVPAEAAAYLGRDLVAALVSSIATPLA